MSPLSLSLLRTLRAAGFASEEHLVALCGGDASRVKRALERFLEGGLVLHGPTLGYWITGKGEEAATGNFAAQVRVLR